MFDQSLCPYSEKDEIPSSSDLHDEDRLSRISNKWVLLVQCPQRPVAADV